MIPLDPILRLRTALPVNELAEEIATLLWSGLCRLKECENLEAHRYPDLVRALGEIVRQRISSCDATTGPDRDDPWAHTGGGAPTRAQRLPVCEEHAQSLLADAGPAFQELLNALEEATCDFLNAHAPPFDKPLSSQAADQVHNAIESVVKFHLIQNLSSQSCDSCERNRRGITR